MNFDREIRDPKVLIGDQFNERGDFTRSGPGPPRDMSCRVVVRGELCLSLESEDIPLSTEFFEVERDGMFLGTWIFIWYVLGEKPSSGFD